MEESDKELLELAGKAAGYRLIFWSDKVAQRDPPHAQWNPLTDDGDALRLAVSLRISIDRAEFGRTTAWNHMHNVKVIVYDNDELLATRIAIVRAAAEIGKQKD